MFAHRLSSTSAIGRTFHCRLLTLAAAAYLLAVPVASAQLLSNLTQLSFDLDGVITPDTEWSTIDVTYVGSSSVQYFNLNYNNAWVIQNLPVLSREGLIAQTQQFSFNNGIPARGTNLTGISPISLNATLTPVPTGVPPSLPTFLTFAPDNEIFETGTIPESTFLLPAPLFLTGATAPVTMSAAHRNFPNQEAGAKECAPTAISNSLMFLKDKNPSPQWDGKALDIATMKTATKFMPGMGNWIFHNDNRRPNPNAFWEDKDAYMRANSYPVMTKTTVNFADILQAMKDMKDVELELKGHTVSLVGMTDLGGGKFSLDVAHDAKQGMAGGTKVETLTWDGTTLSGAKWVKGFNYAVIEMFMKIPEPQSALLVAFAMISLLPRRSSRARRRR